MHDGRMLLDRRRLPLIRGDSSHTNQETSGGAKSEMDREASVVLFKYLPLLHCSSPGSLVA